MSDKTRKRVLPCTAVQGGALLGVLAPAEDDNEVVRKSCRKTTATFWIGGAADTTLKGCTYPSKVFKKFCVNSPKTWI